MTRIALSGDNSTERRLQAERLVGAAALQEAQALRYKGQPPLRQLLADRGLWPLDAAKPPRPKEAAQWVLRQTRQPRSSAIYQQLAAQVSTRGCTDAAFGELHATLQAWFAPEGTA